MRYLLLLLLLVQPLGAQTFVPASSRDDRAKQVKLANLLRESVPYAAPEMYQTWWDETRIVCDCSPRVQFTDLQWRSLVGSDLHERGEYWTGIDVVFVLSADTRNPDVIRHEMLHAMLGGDEGHKNKAWRRFMSSR